MERQSERRRESAVGITPAAAQPCELADTAPPEPFFERRKQELDPLCVYLEAS